MLLVYRRDRPVSWSRTEHTTEHKCAQDMALHITELALHTTGPICFDSLACLQIAFLTFKCSLQLLVLPNVCLTITKNNALTTIVPVTHLNARNPLVLVLNRRVHVPPFCVLRNVRLCAGRLGCVKGHRWRCKEPLPVEMMTYVYDNQFIDAYTCHWQNYLIWCHRSRSAHLYASLHWLRYFHLWCDVTVNDTESLFSIVWCE